MNMTAVSNVADEVVRAMFDADPEGQLFQRSIWPKTSCEEASVAIAAVLEDRGYGKWTFVQARPPGEGWGHAWLEWREAGAVAYSIDATLHQFVEYDERFIGAGRTPAASWFTDVKYRGPIEAWPYLKSGEQRPFRLIQAVKLELARQ